MCGTHQHEHAEGHKHEHGGHDGLTLQEFKRRRDRPDRDMPEAISPSGWAPACCAPTGTMQVGQVVAASTDALTSLARRTQVASTGRYDVYARFGRAHLRTGSERGGYFTLVTPLVPSWSAAEIATLKQLDPHDSTRSRPVKGGRHRPAVPVALGYELPLRSRVSLDSTDRTGVRYGRRRRNPYRFEDVFARLWTFCPPVGLATFQAALDVFRRAAEPAEQEATMPNPDHTDHPIAPPPAGNEVTLRYVDHCRSNSLAADRLREAIASSGITRPSLRWRPVHDIRSAAAAGFAGSPTVLINRIDQFPRPASVTGLCCHLHQTEERVTGAPPVDQLVAALRPHLIATHVREQP